eukprot:CAMPEP_0185728308 /NCGR_PEP_ID=MMETSP1171-20130828/3696_1 /TAXON_ID=374046 /ORGANISM="Helicotheca tamensis, Strain CCMP826" /LENGTH=376 /DNA_ID=CAMNT_0028396999 /DNA_START=102 /DNA_END=1232 /DNA_ORIENTATION=+
MASPSSSASTTSTTTNSAPSFTATVASIPPPPPTSPTTPPKPPTPTASDYYDCPPFSTESDYESYTTRISPRRELICPITQEVFTDPVIAEDGHTYERKSLLRWLHQMNRTTSPVTNAILSNTSRTAPMVPNLAIQGMACDHREQAGLELLRRAEYACRKNGGVCADGGARIEALLDAGADTSLRTDEEEGGNTAFHLFVLAGNLELSRILLYHDAPVTTVNKDGWTIVQAAESYVETQGRSTLGLSRRAEWNDFIEELRQKEEVEAQKEEARTQARNRANEEHREQQRNLAEEERRSRIEGRNRLNGTNLRGARGALGDLEDGWGYFPSLAVLQFQGAVPDPPVGMAGYERRAKRRLDVILNSVGLLVLFYFLLS